MTDSAPQKLGKIRRVSALILKESRQIIRDPSSIALAVVMPIILILLFGFALSLDVKDVPLAIVLEDPSLEAREVAAGFQLSPYFQPRLMTSMPEAEQLLLDKEVDGIVRIRSDFASRLNRGDGEVQLVVHGTDANTARIIEAYAQGVVSQWSLRRAAEGYPVTGLGPVAVQSRTWFNEAGNSGYFIVPGLIVLIMTLIGALLTALVVAREWERGTLEALFVTPVRADEILLSKIVPYFALGMVGFAMTVLAAQYLFGVPLRGSLWVLTIVSALYLLVALGIGLVASSATKSQFVASQIALIATLLPALMLSGFIYDIRSMPIALQYITYALPARYFVTLLQTLFLAGDIWSVILPNAAILAVMAVRSDGGRARHDAQATGVRRAMQETILRILALIRKELLAILKDPRSRVILVLPPIFQTLMFGYAATFDLNRVPYAVLDQDRSAASSELLAKLDGSRAFQRIANISRAADIQNADRQPRRAARRPDRLGFRARLLAGQPADIQVIVDGRNSNTAGTALGYVGAIVQAFNLEWQKAHGRRGPAVRMTTRAWYNENLETRWNMIPALIGTITMLQTMLLTALSVAREREDGTFEQLLVTPLRPAEIMVGKAVPSTLVGLLQATLILLVAQLWFRIPFVGSFVTLYAGLLLFLIAAVGHRAPRLLARRHDAAGDALLVRAADALHPPLGPGHADRQHAGDSSST